MNGETVYIGNKMPTALSGTAPSKLLSCECHVKWTVLKYMMNTNSYLICSLHVFDILPYTILLAWIIIYFSNELLCLMNLFMCLEVC